MRQTCASDNQIVTACNNNKPTVTVRAPSCEEHSHAAAVADDAQVSNDEITAVKQRIATAQTTTVVVDSDDAEDEEGDLVRLHAIQRESYPNVTASHGPAQPRKRRIINNSTHNYTKSTRKDNGRDDDVVIGQSRASRLRSSARATHKGSSGTRNPVGICSSLGYIHVQRQWIST